MVTDNFEQLKTALECAAKTLSSPVVDAVGRVFLCYRSEFREHECKGCRQFGFCLRIRREMETELQSRLMMQEFLERPAEEVE